VIGLISGTVTAAARSLGHTISFIITLTLMLFVGTMLFHAAAYGSRSYVRGRLRRFGPLVVFCLAAPLILADLVRHVLQDTGVWPECGNNPYFSRINSTDPFPAACTWSSAQYRCDKQCCVPVWEALPASTGPAYGWQPSTTDFFPAKADAPQFATLTPKGSLYLPPGFNASVQPYRVFKAPLVLYADSTPNPLSHRAAADAAACPHGLNAATGYCYLHANASAAESCTCSSCQASENLFHLSPMGLFFTIFCTYSGFVLLAVAVMWNANLHKKLAQVQTRWRELRARM